MLVVSDRSVKQVVEVNRLPHVYEGTSALFLSLLLCFCHPSDVSSGSRLGREVFWYIFSKASIRQHTDVDHITLELRLDAYW